MLGSYGTRPEPGTITSRGSCDDTLLSKRDVFFLLTLLCSISSALFKVTMSFGFSVADFLAAIELVNKIRKEFVDAPSQFKDISDE